MPPRFRRGKAQHQQVADYFKDQILSGELPGGSRLSVRRIGVLAEVGQTVAQDAHRQLKTEGLIDVTAAGSFVSARRVKPGPQFQLRARAWPSHEFVEVTAAGVVEITPEWEYLVPILGLEADPDGVTRVLRRELVTSEQTAGQWRPYALTVTWHYSGAAALVPEMLLLDPLEAPAAGVRLLAERTSRPIHPGRVGFEARPVKADGREVPLLGVPGDGFVLGWVWTWRAPDDQVMEYGEQAVVPGKAIEADLLL